MTYGVAWGIEEVEGAVPEVIVCVCFSFFRGRRRSGVRRTRRSVRRTCEVYTCIHGRFMYFPSLEIGILQRRVGVLRVPGEMSRFETGAYDEGGAGGEGGNIACVVEMF